MPDVPGHFDFGLPEGEGYDPSATGWETEAFGTETTFGAEGAVVPQEITDLLTDLLPEGEDPADYLKYLEQYDLQQEQFAGMQQQLSQAGAGSAFAQAESQFGLAGERAETGMRGQMGQIEAGAKGKMSQMLQGGRKVGGFGGRQRALEAGKEDVMAGRTSAMEGAEQQRDFALQQADISKTAASDAYSQSMGAADLAYQQTVHGAREDWQDDIFSMITNIVSMVNK